MPIAQYRRNVEAIAEQARALDSRVVSGLPPRTPRMFAISRDGHDYATATRNLADALSLPIVEPTTRFEAFEAQVPQGLRDVDDPWPCFVDVGHPSVLGHELIAEQLFEVMRDQLALAALAGPSATIPTMDVRCERRELTALRPGILELTTPRARQIDRAWLGDRWIPGVTALDDGHLQLELPELLDPGEYALDLRTTTGLSHTNLTFEVTPLALHSRFE